jgi:hypothetical protein
MPSGTASTASFARSRAIAAGSALACFDVEASTSSSRPPRSAQISSIALATSTL